MPWHISEDLQMFKRTTSGHPVVMGRKTFESLGRPLPNRKNVIITRNRSFDPAAEWPGADVLTVGSLSEAVNMFPSEEEIFIIGGGQIYAEAMAMPEVGRLYLTRIHADYDGDVRFPKWDPAEWHLVSRERHEHGKEFPHPFEFLVYERR